MLTISQTTAPLERTVMWILAVAGLPVLAHAFIPLDEFVHRTDDAFYYLKIAYNYPAVGFWSFDSIHTTNGVQPLWAWLLTAIAQLMAWAGVRDPDLFARCVVGITALFFVGAALLLFRLLARQVSLAAGTAAAAALLMPMGSVWRHVGGMENSLYAFCMVGTLSYYQLSFRARETTGRAVVLGVLLGLTALARLNAVLLAVCAVGAMLMAGSPPPLRQRVRYAAIVAAVSAATVVPYLFSNYVSTGHALPISGTVKAVLTDHYLHDHAIDSRFSLPFIKLVVGRYDWDVAHFVASRIADASAVLGGRLVLGDEERASYRLLAALALLAVLPLLTGPRAWLSQLRAALVRLQPFWYVLPFALINAAISAFSYPQQIGNAMVKWWLVDSELILVVLAGTVAGMAVARLGGTLLPERVGPRLAAAALTLLVAAHGWQATRFYWDGRFQVRDWNASWNDESLLAARWLAAHVPDHAIVGSWNAGILGYYATHRVTNLDGLINNYSLLPYVRNRNIAAYILKENVSYLSDMESMLALHRIDDRLTLREVYRHPNAMMRQDYVIYRVEGARDAAAAD